MPVEVQKENAERPFVLFIGKQVVIRVDAGVRLLSSLSQSKLYLA